MVIPCTGYTQQTRDFIDGFEQIVGGDARFSTIVIINVGEESLFLQLEQIGAVDFVVFEVAVGAHVVVPSSVGNGTALAIDRVSMRSETAAGSRAVIITVQNN
jgi:hypothetical protein